MVNVLLFFLIQGVISPQNNLNDVKQIKNSEACFSGKLATYDLLVDYFEGKSRKDDQNFNRLKFEEKYTKQAFEQSQKNVECHLFTYGVDGLIVDGFLIKPKNVNNAPVIIFNRGGSGTYGNMTVPSIYFNLYFLAENGFAVIGSQYRGGTNRSLKSGAQDEFGGQDVNDVMALFPIIDQIDDIDANRIGMYGVSRGSINSFLAATRTTRIKALVSASGIYDLESDLSFRPSMEKRYKEFIPDYEINKAKELKKRSVIQWAEKLDSNAPILLIHSSYDERTSAEGAIKFAQKLQSLFRRYSLVMFEAGDHFFSNDQVEMRDLVIEWFKKYL